MNKLDPEHEKALDAILRLLQEKLYWKGRYLIADEYWKSRCMAAEEFILQMPDTWTDLTPGQQKAVVEYEKFLKENKEPA